MRRAPGLAFWWALLLVLGCEASAASPELDLPPRPGDAPGGEAIARDLRGLGLDAREERIYQEIARGNVPGWLRELRPVEVAGQAGGREHRVTLWVTPDYLAVGSAGDHLLLSLSPGTAQRIADLTGTSLPTPPMVDAIWASADARLPPQRIRPDEHMETMRYMERHQALIEGQRTLRSVSPGTFVAGHKKDVVISSVLAENPGKVAIYGWHGTDGEPIQPLNTVLAEDWVGFNHGVRLVHRRILVDGEERDLLDVLRDPDLAPLLSRRGTIAEPRYPMRREGEEEGEDEGDTPAP